MIIKLILFMLIFAIPQGSTLRNRALSTTAEVKIKIEDELIDLDTNDFILDFGTNIKGSKDIINSVENVEMNVLGVDKKKVKIVFQKETTLTHEEDKDSEIKFKPELIGDITDFEEIGDYFSYSLEKKEQINLELSGKIYDLKELKSGQYKGVLKVELLSY